MLNTCVQHTLTRVCVCIDAYIHTAHESGTSTSTQQPALSKQNNKQLGQTNNIRQEKHTTNNKQQTTQKTTNNSVKQQTFDKNNTANDARSDKNNKTQQTILL